MAEAVPIEIVLATEFGLGFFLLGLTIALTRRFFQRNKNIIIRYLLLALICGSSAPLLSATAHIVREGGGWQVGTVYLEIMAFMNTVSLICGVFFLCFCLELFYNGAWNERNKKIMQMYIFLVIVIIIFTFLAPPGFIMNSLPDDNTTFLHPVSHMLLGGLYVPIFVVMLIASYRLVKKLEDPVDKRCMQIFLAGPAVFLFNIIFFVIDSIVEGQPLLIINTFISASSTLLIYLGFIQPEWFLNVVRKSLNLE